MNEIVTRINKSTKYFLGGFEIFLFISFIGLIVTAFLTSESFYILVSLLVGLVFFLYLNIVFDFNKTFIINRNGIMIYKKNKIKKALEFKDIKKAYTAKFFLETFIIIDDSKKGFIIPFTVLSKSDLYDLKKMFSWNNIVIEDKKKLLKGD